MPCLRIVSDLHTEFAPWPYEPAGEDMLILAGDIGVVESSGKGFRGHLWRDISRHDMLTIYVLGNHEGYGTSMPRDELVASIRKQVPDCVHVLDRESLYCMGLRFLGCSLWTDFSLRTALGSMASEWTTQQIAERCSQMINDFTCLSQRQPTDGKPVGIGWGDMAAWHREERDWLAAQIDASHAPTVVVTHFLPSPQSLHPRYGENILNAYFATDCRALMKEPVRLWVHGHSHSSCDYQQGAVRVVCNPRGYVQYGNRENSEFKKDLIVDLR